MDTQRALTPEEQKLLVIFRSLDEGQQHKVMLACEAIKVADAKRNRAFG